MGLYRYVDTAQFDENANELALIEYEVIKETPKGYWIKFVLGQSGTILYADRMRKFTTKAKNSHCYAFPSKQEAWDAYVKRKTEVKVELEMKLITVKANIMLAIKTKADK